MAKIKAGIIGTGNIGTDILMKLQRSNFLECGIFAGRNHDSRGIEIAKKMGVSTSVDSIKAIESDPDCCEIVFDATSASAHKIHAPILKSLDKFVIDLTPSKLGKMCIPVLNIDECLEESNLNLVTCGGQASIPIACAIKKIHPEVNYFEVVSSMASKSAGQGTRDNIDEFTQTTRDALIEFTNTENAKAIIILNPAEPPITMKTTVYALINNPDIENIRKEVKNMVNKIQKYVPGYSIVTEPVYKEGKLTIILQVIGLGDYLPKYAGNLDIITCAAIEIGEKYAEKRLLG